MVWEHLGKNAPDIPGGDLETIHQPLDFLGFNVYFGHYVRAVDKGLESLCECNSTCELPLSVDS